MGKSKTHSKSQSKAETTAAAAASRPSKNNRSRAREGQSEPVAWPKLPPKPKALGPETIHWHLSDQVGVVHNFFTPSECQAFIRACSSQTFSPSPPAKRGEAHRTNERWSVEDALFADTLWSRLHPTCSAWLGIEGWARGKHPSGLNSNIRVYKYFPGQAFGAHYDGSVVDTATGKRSEWTLLIYLTGSEDGVKGGETVFYHDHARRADKELAVPLERGAALLHRHGDVS